MKSLNLLIESMELHPHEWIVCRYHAKNDVLNISIWIANGFLFCTPENVPVKLNLFHKWRLWRACKKLIENKLVYTLETRNNGHQNT